jgi:hypothetical protein
MRPGVTLAQYDYPPVGVPFFMCLVLFGLCIFTALMLGYEKPWESGLVKASAVFGVVVVVFMTWASITGG